MPFVLLDEKKKVVQVIVHQVDIRLGVAILATDMELNILMSDS